MNANVRAFGSKVEDALNRAGEAIGAVLLVVASIAGFLFIALLGLGLLLAAFRVALWGFGL
ncbi:MAG: hypothetical protein Q8R78_04795 [Candidatus Omnitrophota bacterium]|nr:hypothetical protein [Candidatus Omnitrophota bacterium]